METNIKKPFVLVVDDNSDAIFLLRRLLIKAGIEEPIEQAVDGDAAITFLAERLRAGRDGFPLFVLLDVKMPRRDGFEVLEWIRLQPELRELIVFMISSSAEEADVKRAYELGADSYLVKNPDPAVFAHVYAVAMEIRSRGRRRSDAASELSRHSVRLRDRSR
jgi:CheY-like chemotaxis protein